MLETMELITVTRLAATSSRLGECTSSPLVPSAAGPRAAVSPQVDADSPLVRSSLGRALDHVAPTPCRHVPALGSLSSPSLDAEQRASRSPRAAHVLSYHLGGLQTSPQLPKLWLVVRIIGPRS